ncbi:MAG: DUF1800 domain-containing protein [Actinobacteria bacterium]|nr:DUF1800 domain-containing protein [Actinomycetota bacterium]
MTVSKRERISHVVRRLSMGAHPDAVLGLDSTDAAIAAALDLSAPAPEVAELPVPTNRDDATRVSDIGPPIAWWVERMRAPDRRIEKHLVWFWHDHFATAISKVGVLYLMMRQHATIRAHATSSFRDLLHAMATDPSMLVYLDGVSNRAQARNENFGRECLELFTLGRDLGYTQDDVVAMSRSSTGWLVNAFDRPRLARAAGAPGAGPYDAFFVPALHDQDPKTLLGTTAAPDLPGALDVLLKHPGTAQFVATKLYRELVGLDPDTATARRLGKRFGADYAVMPLVEAIVAEPALTADAAVRARVRTPVEKLVALLQAVPDAAPVSITGEVARHPAAVGMFGALRTLGYVSFNPPNVGGYPKGTRLLGPHQLTHGFGLLSALGDAAAIAELDARDALARFGIHDASERTIATLERESDLRRRFALAFGTPEVALT